MKKLIIFGAGTTAKIACDYFNNESNYKVCGFTEDAEYFPCECYREFTVYPFHTIKKLFDPKTYDMFIAIGYAQLNHTRERIYKEAKAKGYKLASFISPYAYINKSVKIGDNCFIQEFNNIQYEAEIGNNTFIWAKNHIGHHSKIGNNCFLASGITISGTCKIGDYTFIGSGSSIGDNIAIGKNCLLGVGSTVSKDVGEETVAKCDHTGKFTFESLSEKAKKMWEWK